MNVAEQQDCKEGKMALTLQTIYKGLTAEYWKIISVSENMMANQTLVRLALYKDKATRDANIADFIDLRALTFDGLDLTREAIYPLIKGLTEFSTATDC